MKLSDIPVPGIYKESMDFRFFIRWFSLALSKLQYDISYMTDIYDPLKCPKDLLWMLSDTIGFNYDDRMPAAYNRLVLLYFASMIRNKGSRDGVTLAASVNLSQFNILDYARENDKFEDRLDDTSIPVNSVYVNSDVKNAYIEVIYYSTEVPLDCCLEYVRPLGMYCFQRAGVKVNSSTKIAIDGKLTNIADTNEHLFATHIGHYSRKDYASIQKMQLLDGVAGPAEDSKREGAYLRNSEYESSISADKVDAGYRSLYSLQLCNNAHIVRSLIRDEITDQTGLDTDYVFGLGLGPQDVSVEYSPENLQPPYVDKPLYNLLYNPTAEEAVSSSISTIDKDQTTSILEPKPAVAPRVGSKLGHSI